MNSHTRNAPLPVYFVDMELGGQSLEYYIKTQYSASGDRMRPGEIWDIMTEIAAGVAFLHKRRMVHRDLKPANGTLHTATKLNIVIHSGTLKGCWKVTDFGISTIGTAKRLIATKDGRGTPSYRAPEILFSEASIPSYTNKVDIWGLGTILYELCTGKRAFPTDYHVMDYFRNGESPHVSLSDNPHLKDIWE